MKELNLYKIQNKLRNKFLKSGVKMMGPETIFFSSDTKIGKNVTIEPYVVIGKKVNIGNTNFKTITVDNLSELKVDEILKKVKEDLD